MTLEDMVIAATAKRAARILAGERLPCAACGEGDVGLTPCGACGTNAADSGMVLHEALGLPRPKPLFEPWCGFIDD
jgi:hypothetical protein